MELDGDDGCHTVKVLSPTERYILRVFPGDSAVKNLCAIQKKIQVQSLDREKSLDHTPVFLPGESHGQRNLTGCSPWGRKELHITDMTEHPSQHKHFKMANFLLCQSSHSTRLSNHHFVRLKHIQCCKSIISQ